jgi:hypothetical protein
MFRELLKSIIRLLLSTKVCNFAACYLCPERMSISDGPFEDAITAGQFRRKRLLQEESAVRVRKSGLFRLKRLRYPIRAVTSAPATESCITGRF